MIVLDKKILIIILIISTNIVLGGVADKDVDGVPNEKDLCPNSKTTIVDPNGCSCIQKTSLNCETSCCQVTENPCVQQCGESGGQAICNLWDYNICPIQNEITETVEKTRPAQTIKKIETTQPIESNQQAQVIVQEQPNNQKEIIEPIAQEQIPPPQKQVVQQQTTNQLNNEILPSKTGGAFLAPQSKNEQIKQLSMIIIPSIILIIIIILILIHLKKQSKKIKTVKGYIKQNIINGYSIQTLEDHLRTHGWDPKILKKVIKQLLKEKK